MVLRYICAGVAVLISYLLYSVVTITDITKTVTLKNQELCEKLPIPMPTEDLTVYKEFLIGATFDAIPANHKHLSASECRPGFLISINPSTKAAKTIPMHGFPPEFQLNAHGIKLYNDKTLYVISHGYAKGGERIFLFDLEIVNGEVEATYKDNFYFEGEHGLYNGIALVDEKHFFLTQWIPFADTEAGRDNSKLVALKRTLMAILGKSCPIKFCTVFGLNQVKCVDKAYGGMPNGIEYKDKKVVVADSVDKSVKIYNVNQNFDLELVERVQIDHSVDNLWWENGDIFVAGIARIWDFIMYSENVRAGKPANEIPGGASKIYLKDGKWVAENIIMQDKLSLPATVVVTDKIIFSSIHEASLLICPKVN